MNLFTVVRTWSIQDIYQAKCETRRKKICLMDLATNTGEGGVFKFCIAKSSEYDREVSQSHNTDKPMALG